MGHVTMTTPIRLTLDIFHLHTKFGDSCFSHSRDVTAGIDTENGSRDPDYAPFRGTL